MLASRTGSVDVTTTYQKSIVVTIHCPGRPSDAARWRALAKATKAPRNRETTTFYLLHNLTTIKATSHQTSMHRIITVNNTLWHHCMFCRESQPVWNSEAVYRAAALYGLYVYIDHIFLDSRVRIYICKTHLDTLIVHEAQALCASVNDTLSCNALHVPRATQCGTVGFL